MSKLKYPDTQSRNEAIAVLEKERKAVEQQAEPPKKERDALVNANADKLNKRSGIEGQINGKKKLGKALIVIGLIIAAVAAISGSTYGIAVIIGGCAVGVALLIGGIVILKSTGSLTDQLKQMNTELSEFDKKNNALSAEINELDGRIASIQNEIESIRREERYAKYYEWADRVETGHVALFVSTHNLMLLDKPENYTPGKKYDSSWSRDMFLYSKIVMDDMVYAQLGNRDYGKICLTKVEPGTHKLELVAGYCVTRDNPFERVTEPIPIRGDGESKFVRMHLCMCKNGTKLYISSYNDFDEFLKDIGMSIDTFIREYLN